MTIAQNLANQASSINASGVLQTAGGGTSLASPGAAGQVLTSNGTSWTSAAPSGGGSMVLLSTTSASGTQVLITSGFSSTYDDYVLYADGIKTTGATGLYLQGRMGGAVATSGYYGTWLSGAGANPWSAVSNGFWLYLGVAFNTLTLSSSFVVNICNANDTSSNRAFSWYGTGSTTAISGSGTNTSTSALDGISFAFPDSSPFTAGTFRLYGIKKT